MTRGKLAQLQICSSFFEQNFGKLSGGGVFIFFNDFGGDGAEGLMCGAGDPHGDGDGEGELEGVECPGPRALVDAAFGSGADDRTAIGIRGTDWQEAHPRGDDVTPEIDSREAKSATHKTMRQDG